MLFSSTGPSASVQPVRAEPDAQLLPHPLVGPARHVLVRIDLDVEPADLRRAQAVQREAALVPRVDELVGRRRHLGQDAQPREREVALVHPQRAGRDRRPRHAVRSVAAGHEVAAQLVGLPVRAIAHQRPRGVEIRQRHVLDLEPDRPAGRQARGDEVLDHLLLPVDRDRAPEGQVRERDAVAGAVEGEQDAAVDQPLAAQAIGHAQLVEQLDSALLQHAGAHAVLDVRAAAVLEHDRLDALAVQQVRQDQAGRAGPDDGDLCVHSTLVCPGIRTDRPAGRCAA